MTDEQTSFSESDNPSGADETHVEPKQRWLAAIAYLGPVSLFSLTRKHKSSFLLRHARQAFALFLVEAATICFLIIVSNTIGRIPVLGFLVEILLELAAFVAFLILSILGFVRGLAGEGLRIPVLEEYAEKIPVGR
jgi:uncharacterized membrane protein